MNESVRQVQEEIVSEFEMFDDWSDKYDYIIGMGKNLPELPENLKTEENKVRGCQSNVWLLTDMKDDKLLFRVDSDALVVKGLAAILMRVFSDRTADEILEAKLDFLDKIGLSGHLSPTRSNGLQAMIRQIKYYAVAYKASMSG